MARIATRPLTPAENAVVNKADTHESRDDCEACQAADDILSRRTIAGDTSHPLHAQVRSEWESGS